MVETSIISAGFAILLHISKLSQGFPFLSLFLYRAYKLRESGTPCSYNHPFSLWDISFMTGFVEGNMAAYYTV